MKPSWTLVCTMCLTLVGTGTVLAGDGAGAATKSSTPAQPAPATQPASTNTMHGMMSDSTNMTNSNMMSHSGMANSNMANSMMSKSGSMSHPETMSQAGMAHAHMNLTKDEVKSIQKALQQAGDDPGAVDGVLGKRTHAALRSYQKAHSLKVTGIPDDETCARLGVKTEAHASSPM